MVSEMLESATALSATAESTPTVSVSLASGMSASAPAAGPMTNSSEPHPMVASDRHASATTRYFSI